MSLAPSRNAALNRCEKRELMCSINATESIFKTILLNRASYCALWEVIMMHAVQVFTSSFLQISDVKAGVIFRECEQ